MPATQLASAALPRPLLPSSAVISLVTLTGVEQHHWWLESGGIPHRMADLLAAPLRRTDRPAATAAELLDVFSPLPRLDAAAANPACRLAGFRYLFSRRRSGMTLCCWRQAPSSGGWQRRCGPLTLPAFIRRYRLRCRIRQGSAHSMSDPPPLWSNRHQAGVALAEVFSRGHGPDPSSLLLALPRGGVPVAAAMAGRLQLPLATWSVRKVADPSFPELAIGAVAPAGVAVWRHGEGAGHRATTARRHGWLRAQEEELRRRQQRFGDPPAPSLRGRPLIVVDDGIATGMTVKAALLSLRKLAPASLALAVPVVAREVVGELTPLVDRFEALAVVDDLQAVGLWYEHFEQLQDAEVLDLLSRARAARQTLS